MKARIIAAEDVPGTKELVSTTFSGLPNDVKPGDFLLIDDGKVRVKVLETDGTTVTTEVIVAGPVSNNKGINLPGVAVSVPALSEKDEDDLRWALRRGCDIIALSFVRDASDVERAHEIMDEEGVRRPIIAKIEKPQAVDALEDIVEAFDGIMVARGDLGVELPLEAVPIVQKRAVSLARRLAKPVIVATQMLESMIQNPVPTRAETSDVANAVLDGADAVMLSGETSVGAHAVTTVETMARIVESTEEHGLDRIESLTNRPRTQGGVITKAAIEVAEFVEANSCASSRSRAIRPPYVAPALAHPDGRLHAGGADPSSDGDDVGHPSTLVEMVDHTDLMFHQVDDYLQQGLASRRSATRWW